MVKRPTEYNFLKNFTLSKNINFQSCCHYRNTIISKYYRQTLSISDSAVEASKVKTLTVGVLGVRFARRNEILFYE